MAISREGALDWPLRRVFAKREVDIFTARGLHTLSDLMHWVPRTYLSSVPIERHFEDGERVHLVADVVSSREVPMRSRKGSLLKVLVDAGNQKFELTFFQTRPHKFILSPGRRALFAGKVAAFNGRWQLAQPEYVLLSSNGVDDQTIETLAESPLIPIYRRMGTKLGSWGIAKAVIVALDSLWAVADPVQELAARHELPPLYETFRLVHRPVDLDEPQIGRRRLKYDEALAIQVVLAMRRAATSGDAAVARAGAVGECSTRSTHGCPSASPRARSRPARCSPRSWLATDRCTACCRARSAPARPSWPCARCCTSSTPVVRPPCWRPPRCWPSSTTAPSPRCWVTSRWAACSAATT
ncbi:hypothetical protein GCM10025862_12100 [Arsenicicoccus piscis]|uniref:ATP-dependent DNA helicase RecG n=1 Tax=Arsenicicoccus piscis TaxID=673954 RepID=A0ABQ6HP10_9MICO|nr:hypothetical protein GCM10025862_12100 [Arsenicicoccus piscis]